MARPLDAANQDHLGAYGLRIGGIDGIAPLLVPADPTWPRLEISVERGRAIVPEDQVDDDNGVVRFHNGGAVVIDRRQGEAVFTLPHEPSPDELVHPYLAPVAAIVSHWHGRETLHAGSFLTKGGVWGLLAKREGGKSTTLARLAIEGVPIVCDDVLVLDEGAAFAGPRAIDLREEPARILGIGESLGIVGARERWRLTLDAIEGRLPLRGWVFLVWGDELALEPVAAGPRLRRLAAQRAVRLAPRDPGALLRLSALPGFELRRPRRWSSLEQAVELLLTSLP